VQTTGATRHRAGARRKTSHRGAA